MKQFDLKTNNRGALLSLGAAVLVLALPCGWGIYRASLPPPRPDPPMSAENQVLTRLVPFVPTPPAAPVPTSSLEPPGYGPQQPAQVTPGNIAPQQDADRAADEVRAAQARYSQASTPLRSYEGQAAPAQDVPGSQAASAPPPADLQTHAQADQRMQELYDWGERDYQRFRTAEPKRLENCITVSGALVDLRDGMTALAPSVTPSRRAEFLRDYWCLNVRENDLGMWERGGTLSNDGEVDLSETSPPPGYTWGSAQ